MINTLWILYIYLRCHWTSHTFFSLFGFTEINLLKQELGRVKSYAICAVELIFTDFKSLLDSSCQSKQWKIGLALLLLSLLLLLSFVPAFCGFTFLGVHCANCWWQQPDWTSQGYFQSYCYNLKIVKIIYQVICKGRDTWIISYGSTDLSSRFYLFKWKIICYLK